MWTRERTLKTHALASAVVLAIALGLMLAVRSASAGFFDLRPLGTWLVAGGFAAYFGVATTWVLLRRMSPAGIVVVHAVSVALAPLMIIAVIQAHDELQTQRRRVRAELADPLVVVNEWRWTGDSDHAGRAIIVARPSYDGTIALGEFSVCQHAVTCRFRGYAEKDVREARKDELVRWELPLSPAQDVPIEDFRIRFYCVEKNKPSRLRDFDTSLSLSRDVGDDASLMRPLGPPSSEAAVDLGHDGR
jgi:hypothetical protein